MKTKILVLGLLLSLSSLAYAADETTVQEDIQSAESIDALIEKMNQAQNQNRYQYMNAIKERISAQKGQDREAKMSEVLGDMTQQRERTQEHMNQEAAQEHSNGFGGSSSGGFGGGMGGGSGGGMGGSSGGGSGGGMGGGSGGGMGGGSGGGMGGGGMR